LCAGCVWEGGSGVQVAHPRHRAGACTLNAVGLLPVSRAWRCEGRPPLPHHFVCVETFTLPYLTSLSLSLCLHVCTSVVVHQRGVIRTGEAYLLAVGWEPCGLCFFFLRYLFSFPPALPPPLPPQKK